MRWRKRENWQSVKKATVWTPLDLLQVVFTILVGVQIPGRGGGSLQSFRWGCAAGTWDPNHQPDHVQLHCATLLFYTRHQKSLPCHKIHQVSIRTSYKIVETLIFPKKLDSHLKTHSSKQMGNWNTFLILPPSLLSKLLLVTLNVITKSITTLIRGEGVNVYWL